MLVWSWSVDSNLSEPNCIAHIVDHTLLVPMLWECVNLLPGIQKHGRVYCQYDDICYTLMACILIIKLDKHSGWCFTHRFKAGYPKYFWGTTQINCYDVISIEVQFVFLFHLNQDEILDSSGCAKFHHDSMKKEQFGKMDCKRFRVWRLQICVGWVLGGGPGVYTG